MSGVPKIEIAESVEELKLLMKQQKTGLGYAKVQSLYLLKINAVETIKHLAVIVGRGESTIHSWLHVYKTGGLSLLLKEPLKTGRPKTLLAPINAQIVSKTPGRVRFRLDHSHRHQKVIEPITEALRSKLEIYRVRSNVASGSITVFHGRELLNFKDLREILSDLGIILSETIETPFPLNSNHSEVSVAINQAALDLNRRVKQATQGSIDLRFLLPFGFGILALRQLKVRGLQLEFIPWYVLAWYAFDSFIKLNQTSGQSINSQA